MKISQINLTNFRIYKGENIVSFSPFTDKNINIIAGKNGYGKTTFLTSLIWVFYGKLMGQVEDKYRRDIKSYGGYDNFLRSLINKDIHRKFESGSIKTANFSIEVTLTDLLVPSIPCKEVRIKRSFNLANNKEDLTIFIDGTENELTKEVGYEVFINDFILPREIAKFFFFDAEKIVSLAEAKSKEELRSLSKAYSEVLGIKKYEDLKKNLETLLTKLRRAGVSGMEKSKLDSLLEKEKELKRLIELNLEKQLECDREIIIKRKISDELQEKLIREGNSITLEELKNVKSKRDELTKESSEIKSRLNDLMEFAPLIIAGKKLVDLRDQLLKEQSQAEHLIDSKIIKKEIESFSEKVLKRLKDNQLPISEITTIEKILNNTIKENNNQKENNTIKSVDVLLDFNKDQNLAFEAIYSNIKGNYVNQLNAIVQEEKNNRVVLSRTNQKIKQAEARKDNEIVKKYREERDLINERISTLTKDKNSLLEEIGELKNRLRVTRKESSEYEKNFKLIETDRKKYDVTENLLSKINTLITRIKEEKKYALQKALKLGLNKLMHKDDFVSNIKVNIDGDIMDIDLLDSKNNVINKDSLSKGEQQLYATALLKALVDESGIQFPVFIDSPLQKFDKNHSQNIIQEFYPEISNQVVLLPLLEKELTEEEYMMLKPNLSKTFMIESNKDCSTIKQKDLMEVFKKAKEDVYSN
ncbi:DNA sulfur modification protein DndD [Polaribacter sp. Hel_I_88]|uniref:DNA sulfur modification protein DndD n=1 Tax=Polaribacter sp. Hel_I_88 TaxID=1250006 RepID=UPI00047EC95F|nr:DNA sulfur modification protein DndD [Polaribacter sp. Hel_I_88]